jgi:hypothetical protein
MVLAGPIDRRLRSAATAKRDSATWRRLESVFGSTKVILGYENA